MLDLWGRLDFLSQKEEFLVKCNNLLYSFIKLMNWCYQLIFFLSISLLSGTGEKQQKLPIAALIARRKISQNHVITVLETTA